MIRRLFTFVSVLSLLLFVATCVLWVRSYDVTYSWSRTAYLPHARRSTTSWGYALGRAISAWSGKGSILFGEGEVMDWKLPEKPLPSSPTYSWRVIKPALDPLNNFGNNPPGTSWHGFYWEFSPHSNCLIVPCWSVTLLAALPTVVFGSGLLLSRRRRISGRCPACGYDLRATPGRCPECGRAPAAR